MAGLTTFTTGLWMMPSKILAYNQMGEFLMTVMIVSWLFATFFMQSVCYLIGPEGNFLQFPSWFTIINACSNLLKSHINFNKVQRHREKNSIYQHESSNYFIESDKKGKNGLSSTENEQSKTEKILSIKDIIL